MATMDNKVKVVIYPSGVGEEALTVTDAMQQVLDYFVLLSKAETQDPNRSAKVLWRLDSATTNSPLTVEASAISSDPSISVDRAALFARRTLREGVRQLLRTESKPVWLDYEAEKVMRRMLDRNLNGIGRTDIITEEGEAPIVLDHRSALRVQKFLDVKAAEAALLVEDLSRKEHGAIEGEAIGLTTHYKKPALLIRERLSGREVKSVWPAGLAEGIGAQRRWSDVWSSRRVLVSGVCHYDRIGNLTLIEADEISLTEPTDVHISDVRDVRFTNGLTPLQHLDRLWGDSNG